MSSQTAVARFWYPPDVEACLSLGNEAWIGIVDDTTVLKFPLLQTQALKDLWAEADIYRHLGPNPYTIQYKGLHTHGILLQRMHNGSLAAYVENQEIKMLERCRLALQVTEALVFFHSRNLVYCDLKPENILMDDDNNIKFCAFKGQVSDSNGTVTTKARGLEKAKFRSPRATHKEANVETDLFALGTTIYYILNGHRPWPALDEVEDCEEIQTRFLKYRYPKQLGSPVTRIIRKCWNGNFTTAAEVVEAFAEWDAVEFSQPPKPSKTRTGGS